MNVVTGVWGNGHGSVTPALLLVWSTFPKAKSWELKLLLLFFPFPPWQPLDGSSVIGICSAIPKEPAKTKDYLHASRKMFWKHHRAAGHIEPKWKSAGNSTLTSVAIYENSRFTVLVALIIVNWKPWESCHGIRRFWIRFLYYETCSFLFYFLKGV